MAFLFMFVFNMLFGMIEVLDECSKYHNCLTCSVYPYNCASCPKGYHLARGGAYYTCKSCPSECSECDNSRHCTKCHLKGLYGQNCKNICSKGCINSTCDHLSGTCLCRQNYEGSHCDYCAKGKYDINFDCSKDCPPNCKRCVSRDKCSECQEGFFGEVCEFNCSRGCYLGRCNKESGRCYQDKCKPNFDGVNCSTCSAGLYGTNCQFSCPGNCVSCSSNTSCDECTPGFWGSACQRDCSYGCFNSSCIKESGVCKTGECREGFIGAKCDRCNLGKSGNKCNMDETSPGQEEWCPRGCLTCGGGGVHCSSCVKGFYNVRDGAYSQCKECPPECSECYGHRVAICVGCKLQNRYGRDCRKFCSEGCRNFTCDKNTGECACKDNYEGSKCDYCAKGKYGIHSACLMDCPKNCKRCTSDNNCTECKDGFFGEVCEFNCSRGCYLGRCDKSNGTCYKDKCKPNFHDINCTRCSPGFYGTYCLLSCPNTCVSCSSNTSCDKCKHGYWGDACQRTCYHWFCVGNA